MQIWIDRDSVSAGDDEQSHRRTVEVADDATLADVLADVYAQRFLPDTAGEVPGLHSWLVVAGRPPRDSGAVAVVSSFAPHYRFLVDAGTRIGAATGDGGLYFRWRPDTRPEAVQP